MDQGSERALSEACRLAAVPKTPPTETTLHGLVARAAERAPEVVAVEDKRGTSLTYAELWTWTAAVAWQLREAQLVLPSVVPVMLPRQVELVVAFIGVLRAGAAYLPLATATPPDVFEELAGKVGATHALALEGPPSLTIIDVNAVRTVPSGSMQEDVLVQSEDLAYVIFTSGSTGRPKGVMMEHGGIAFHIAACAHVSAHGRNLRSCFSNSVTFDVHVADIFMPLHRNGTILVENDIFRITPCDVLSTLPSKLCAALVPTFVKAIRLNGEKVTAPSVSQIPPTTRIINIYGAAEFFDATVQEIEPGSTLDALRSVGLPLPTGRVRCLLADPVTLELVPVGEPGELFVANDQLARGYVGMPDVTDAKFIAPPAAWGEPRVYRTGDLMRRKPDGTLDFIGRSAHQVEVRGERVDLAVLEDAAAAALEAETVVVVQRDALLAFTTAAAVEEPTLAVGGFEVAVRQVDMFPRLPSGKVNRAALLRGDESAPVVLSKPPKRRWLFRDPEASAEAGAQAPAG